MTNFFALNDCFSTTRCLTQERPVIESRSEDQIEPLLFWPKGEGRQGEGGLRTQKYFKLSQTDKPLISVLTVVYNGAEFIQETIQSVIEQTYDNVEYIVIDGGSTDGTLEIIKKYEHAIDYWISEKDNGMYDAIAKGLRLVTGDIVAYINAGDYYHKSCFEVVCECFVYRNISWLTGYEVLYNEKSQVCSFRLPGRFRRNLIRSGVYGHLLPHIQQESTFWSAKLNKDIDLRELSKYKLAGDSFIWSQLALHTDLCIVSAYLGGFKIHHGQLSSSEADYKVEMKRHIKKMNLLDYIQVVIDRIAMLFNDGINCRLNKKIITFDHVKKQWK